MSATFFAGKELPSAQINEEDRHILLPLPQDRDLNLTGGLHCQMCELLCSVPRCSALLQSICSAPLCVVVVLLTLACDKRTPSIEPSILFPSASELRPTPTYRRD